MGALSVDLSEAQAAADKAVNDQNAALLISKLASLTNPQTDAVKLRIMKAAFITKLFELYQWRLLLFARGFPAANAAPVVPAGYVGSTPDPKTTIWEQLVARIRPTVAALGPYFDPDANLMMSFGPNIPSSKHSR